MHTGLCGSPLGLKVHQMELKECEAQGRNGRQINNCTHSSQCPHSSCQHPVPAAAPAVSPSASLSSEDGSYSISAWLTSSTCCITISNNKKETLKISSPKPTASLPIVFIYLFICSPLLCCVDCRRQKQEVRINRGTTGW